MMDRNEQVTTTVELYPYIPAEGLISWIDETFR